MKGVKKIMLLWAVCAVAILLGSCSAKEYTIADFLNFKPNTLYYYEGTGLHLNPDSVGLSEEEAEFDFSWVVYNDYIDGNRAQQRYMTSFGYSGEVVEYKDGALTMLYAVNNLYDHINIMSQQSGMPTVVLKEPLEKGQKWTSFASSASNVLDTAEITSMNKKVTVPWGTFETMEIVIRNKDGVIEQTQYWAPGIGLIKSTVETTSVTQTHELTEIEENVPLAEYMMFFYDEDENGEPVFEYGVLEYPTNCDLNEVFLTAARMFISERFGYELNPDVKINSLTFDRTPNDTKLVIDLSQAFLDEMKKTGDKEALILRCIVNTMGYLHRAVKVCLNIDGGPYESDNIKMAVDEYMTMTYYQDLQRYE